MEEKSDNDNDNDFEIKQEEITTTTKDPKPPNPKSPEKSSTNSPENPFSEEKFPEKSATNPLDDQNIFYFKNDPYLDSNWFSRLFFTWAFKIIKLCTYTDMKKEYLGRLSEYNNSSNFYKHLEEIWEVKGYKNCKRWALLKTIMRSNLSSLLIIITLSFIYTALNYITTLLIKIFIDYFDPKTDKTSKWYYRMPLWGLGLLFLFCQITAGMFSLHFNVKENILAHRASFELDVFIYHKIMKVSPSSFIQRATQGEIVNFVQVDANRLTWLMMQAPFIFTDPIEIIAYTVLLFNFFGLSYFTGIGVIVIAFLINIKIGRLFRKYQKIMLIHKDRRMKVTTEAFDNIKVLKLYGWENEFRDKIIETRDDEMTKMRTRFNITTSNISLFWLTPQLVAIATIGVYQYFHDQFTISTMLIGLSIFNKLQGPIRRVPGIINNFLESTISLNRIENYIRQPETVEEHMIKGKYDPEGEYAIKIENGCFSWGVRQEEKDFERKLKKLEGRKDSVEESEEKEEKIQVKEEKIEVKVDNIDNEEIEGHRKTTNKIKEELKENLIPKGERDTIMSEKPQNTETKKQKIRKTSDNEITEEITDFEKDGYKIQIPVPKNAEFDVTLKNITLQIKPGEIIGIIGEVGSGKSSLLQAMLNSLLLLNPKECKGIYINGKVGYASQIPWIQNDTIKNNVIFFKPFNKKKYNEVLEKCQLKYDLSNFEGGDLTEIGEKGINLSGGQKVRVSLARTVYAEPDIYLFDDPISALDANIGKKIMNELIIDYLQGKTRIVVTHALHYIKFFDRIFYMKGGKIDWVGTPQEIEEEAFFKSLQLSEFKRKNSGDAQMQQEEKEEKAEEEQKKKEIVKIIKEEDEEIGSVKMKVYIDFSKYLGGKCFLIVILLVMACWQINKGGSDLWLAFWSKPENQEKSKNKKVKWVFFGVYSALGLISVYFIFIRIYTLTVGIIRLGRDLHTDMIMKLIKAPINLFHETIPRGQIYNRLSKDLDQINMSIFPIGDCFVCFFQGIGAFVLCSIFDPYCMIFVPVTFLVGYLVTRFYLKGSRPTTRLEAISRSPILNTISESIPGSTSIRAFEVQQDYLDKYYSRINDCLNLNIAIRGMKIWVQFIFQSMSIAYLTYLVVRTVINEKDSSAQSVGIMFTYSVVLQESLGWAFTCAADVENTMIAMERCLNYTKVKGELPSKYKSDEALIKKNWPQEGKITFKNYSVRYRPNTEIVLKNLNFEIKSKEKIGVVGRTGSGKSTICLCMFRILEAESGTIYIDGVDIKRVGLDILRKNLTIIPQDPCLMEGSLKYNIDPFNQTADEEIVSILKKIGFEYTEADDKILSRNIEQNGANLSVGEKQLVCIARAIFRKTKIVIMDEATANIDMATEEKIQNALNYALDNMTVITVAHRIKTIINYDRILVLDNGMIREYDSPKNLLKDKESLFYKLYSKSTL